MNEYIYLNSYYSEFNQNTKYHRFNLTKPIIGDRNNISLRLSEAEIPVSCYNAITDYNDLFSCKMAVETGDFAEYTATLPQKRDPHQRGPNPGCGGLRWVAVGCGGLRWVAVGFREFQ